MKDACIKVSHELFAPAESSYFTGSYELAILKAGPDLYEFKEALSWQITISNTGDALLVAGTVEGLARSSCARCLTAFEFPVLGEVEGYFLIGKYAATPKDLDEDEFEVLPEDDTIDLAPLLNAALLLELPFIPLCNDDCRGLCSVCGENLNETSCKCHDEALVEQQPDTPNPFAVLKDYPFENQ